MKVVIQCAGTKNPQAGYWQTKNGKHIMFIAHSERSTVSDGMIHAMPDGLATGGTSWRDLLWEYNQTPESNPYGLYAAFHLYHNNVYRKLVTRYGVDNVFILSAGWGLIRADFLTPQYNITFSQSAPTEYRRTRGDRYKDFCMIPNDGEPLVFFGGKDYLPLFASLTRGTRAKRNVFYNSASPPNLPGCSLIRYRTATRTNWHYECAKAFVEGEINIRG